MGNTFILKGNWGFAEYLGSIRTMLGINRNTYAIEPGLYSLGNPDSESAVLLTANYKLTVDILMREVASRDLWMLVLDTKGINVWCAAGKGTFGTEEIINRIGATELGKHVSHRKLIVPQLGAPGINPREVKERSGFSVFYGPVEAKHIGEFLDNRWRVTKEMRKKDFPLKERMTVGTTHFAQGMKWALAIAAAFILLDLLFMNSSSYAFNSSLRGNLLASFAALFSGSFLCSSLLPLLPGRAFALKGLFASIPIAPLLYLVLPSFTMGFNWMGCGKILILTAFIVFQCLNLTGSSTYTSLSGVKKEMLYAIPSCIIGAVTGLAMILTGGIFL